MYGSCLKCKKIGARREHHHIIYELPEVVTLCQNPCHNKITLLNTVVARCLNRPLTNPERLVLWDMFLNSPLHTMWKRIGKKKKKIKRGKKAKHQSGSIGSLLKEGLIMPKFE